ncbi:MAG TPA: MraY family glycosyltransferase [Chloroflexota bacterium]
MDLTTWYALIIVAAAVAAIPLVLAAEFFGRAVGLVDLPRASELQVRALPRTGGYGVFLAVWGALALSFVLAPANLERLSADNQRLFGLFIGSLLLLPLAFLDDRRRLGPTPQLIGQIVVVSIPVLFGLHIEELATPFGIVPIPLALSIPVTILWMIAMINAINLLDTLDGLAGSTAAIAAGVLFLRSAWFNQASIAILPAALAGGCLGFLTRNWHPARVILGSSGSYFLGYMLGGITVIGGAKIGTALLVLAVPILDVAWVMYRRLSQGLSPLQGGDSEHLPHRLRQLGLKPPVVALAMCSVSALVGAAVLLTHAPLPTVGKLYLALATLILVGGGIVAVAKISSVRNHSADHSKTPANPAPDSSLLSRPK